MTYQILKPFFNQSLSTPKFQSIFISRFILASDNRNRVAQNKAKQHLHEIVFDMFVFAIYQWPKNYRNDTRHACILCVNKLSLHVHNWFFVHMHFETNTFYSAYDRCILRHLYLYLLIFLCDVRLFCLKSIHGFRHDNIICIIMW